MKTLIRIALIAAAMLTLAGCPSVPKEATDQGSVIHTKADGSKVENRSDYADYAHVKLKLAERPLFEMTCPPQGCVVASLKVNNPTSGADLAPPAKPVPEPGTFEKTLMVVDRAAERGLQIYGAVTGKRLALEGIKATVEMAKSKDQATVDLVDKISQGNARIAGFITTPAPNITYNAGRDLNTGGTQSNDNSSVANNCASGNPGAGGTASTQSPPPATGSQANAGSSGASGGVECRR